MGQKTDISLQAKVSKHFKKYALFYLIIILILATLLRLRFIGLCDVGDRCQTVFGMTNNLPPLYHYVTYPFLELTDNLWYSPAFANIVLSLLSILILFSLGKLLKDSNLGLLFAFIFAVLPASLIRARFISPEELELFFIVLILYLFIRLEILNNKNNRAGWQVLYFFSIVLGAFSKQQTIAILFPIFLFGFYKYRLKIFKKELYYITGLAAIPYFCFLIAHPELLAAIQIYVLQPIGQRTLDQRLFGTLAAYVLYYLIHSMIILYFFAKIKNYWRRLTKDFSLFVILLLVFYTFFIIKTDIYYHLLALPVVLIVGLVVFYMKNLASKCVWLLLLLLYGVIGFFLLVPGLSIVTHERCEFGVYGLPPTYLMELFQQDSPVNGTFFKNDVFLEELLKGEKYVLIGGNTGQDLKYNIKSRMYYPGVINDVRFKEINYAVLVYPIDTAYTGASAWDYQYLKQLVEQSEIILNRSYINDYDIVVLRITNHSTDALEVSDYRSRSRTGLMMSD
jgi:hypothetical protein